MIAPVRLLLAIALALALAACAADDTVGVVCGDGFCEHPETATTCAADCNASVSRCGDGICASGESHESCPADCGCARHADCRPDQVCLGGECNLAFGRHYRLTLVGAEISSTQPGTGEPWDALGGAPDPFIAVSVDGEPIAVTDTLDDTFTPTWLQSVDVLFATSSTTVVLDLFDEDLASHDRITTARVTAGEWLEVLHATGRYVGQSTAANLTVEIAPRP